MANGNALTLVDVTALEHDQASISESASFYPFQKPATRIRYDKYRDRIIAGGLDG